MFIRPLLSPIGRLPETYLLQALQLMLRTAEHLRKIVVGEEGIEPPTFGKCCADALPLSYSPDPNVRTTGGGEPKTIVNSAAFSRTEIRLTNPARHVRARLSLRGIAPSIKASRAPGGMKLATPTGLLSPSSKRASPLLNGSCLTFPLKSPQHQHAVPQVTTSRHGSRRPRRRSG